MILIKRGVFKIGVIYFDDGVKSENVDVLEYYHQPSQNSDYLCTERYSIKINLKQDEQNIFNNMKKETRYEIRRALLKDNLRFEHFSNISATMIDDFYMFYNLFASKKNISPLRKSNRVKIYAEQNRILLSRVFDNNNVVLCYHVYLTINDKARLLFSASMIYDPKISSDVKAMIGRANRALHWQDILYFKNLGYSIYDFGGWYSGNTDVQKLKINNFKESFGGIIYKYYDYIVPITIKGRIYYLLKKCRNK